MDRMELFRNDLEVQKKRLEVLRASDALKDLVPYQESHIAGLKAEINRLSEVSFAVIEE